METVRIRGLLGLCLLAGCDLVFPIGDPAGTEPGRVTGTLVRHGLANPPDGSGTHDPIIETYVATQISSSVDIDGDSAVVELADDGSFAFDVPRAGARYTLRLSIDGRPLQVHHDAASLELVDIALDRPDTVPVTMSTMVGLPDHDTALNNRISVLSTGAWAFVDVSATIATIEWQNAAPIGGTRPALLEIAAGDDFYIASSRLVVADPTISTDIFERLRGQVDFIDGGFFNLPGDLTPSIPDRCLTLSGRRATELGRLEVKSRALTGAKGASVLLAVPDVAHAGLIGAVPLAKRETLDPTRIDDTTIDAIEFENFFIDTSLVAQMSVIGNVEIKHPDATGATSLQMRSDTFVPVVVDTDDCAARVEIIADVAIPEQVTIGDVMLDIDTVIALERSEDEVIVGFTADGPAHAYDVELREVRELGDQTITESVRTITSSIPEVRLLTSELQMGRSYVLVVSARLGQPNAAAGDFTLIEFPIAQATAPSAVFTISN